jgi:hypothetical protein
MIFFPFVVTKFGVNWVAYLLDGLRIMRGRTRSKKKGSNLASHMQSVMCSEKKCSQSGSDQTSHRCACGDAPPSHGRSTAIDHAYTIRTSFQIGYITCKCNPLSFSSTFLPAMPVVFIHCPYSNPHPPQMGRVWVENNYPLKK